MTFYTTIFARSWQMTRKRPVLWLFGFFALFWGGKGIDLEMFFSNTDMLTRISSPFSPKFWTTGPWQEITQLFPSVPLMILFIVLCLVLLVIAALLVMISQIGLVDAFGGWAQSRRKTPPVYPLTQAVEASRGTLKSVFAVNVFNRLTTFVLLALAATPLFFGMQTDTIGQRSLLYTVLLLILITPITIIISLVTKYALAAIVLNKMRASEALRTGWELFRKNIGVSLELAVFMMLIYFLINVVVTVVTAIITFVLSMLIGPFAQSVLPIGLFYVGLFGVLLTVSAIIFSAWHWGNWTLLFAELTKGSKRSKIHRVLYGE
jgi:hypothetical protein